MKLDFVIIELQKKSIPYLVSKMRQNAVLFVGKGHLPILALLLVVVF